MFGEEIGIIIFYSPSFEKNLKMYKTDVFKYFSKFLTHNRRLI